MAMFNIGGNKLKPGAKSNIGNLLISDHAVPAQNYITDKTLPVVFKNPYGGAGNEDVVIPFGKLVAVDQADQADIAYHGKMVTKLTIANGTNPVVGICPQNVVKNLLEDDSFGGNRPIIWTNHLIRLAYIPDSTNSANHIFGHVTGADVKVGDYLKSNASGNFVKWVEGTDSINQRVAQIIGLDMNQEQLGWLKMAMWLEMAKYDDAIMKKFYDKVPNASPEYGMPYTPDFIEGTLNMEQYGYLNDFMLKHTGIPGLTDGAYRQLTRMSGYTVATLPDPTVADNNYVLQLKDATGGNVIDIIESDDPAKKLVVYVNGVEIDQGDNAGQYKINYATGQVTYKATGTEGGQLVTADFCAYAKGTPSWMDFEGVVGQFNVLMKM